MKSIKEYIAPKYETAGYQEISKGIYRIDEYFVTSLSFELEPELGEGDNATQISQYPLEDILDKFGVFISDFYSEMNCSDSLRAYLEFSSLDLDNLINLRKLINCRTYCKTNIVGDSEFIELVIEEEREI